MRRLFLCAVLGDAGAMRSGCWFTAEHRCGHSSRLRCSASAWSAVGGMGPAVVAIPSVAGMRSQRRQDPSRREVLASESQSPRRRGCVRNAGAVPSWRSTSTQCRNPLGGGDAFATPTFAGGCCARTYANAFRKLYHTSHTHCIRKTCPNHHNHHKQPRHLGLG